MHVLRQDVAAHEVAGDVSVLVLLLFMLALDGDSVVNSLDADLLGLELLHVQVDLELVLVVDDVGHAALLAGKVAPGTVVRAVQVAHGLVQVLVHQAKTKVLVEDAQRTRRHFLKEHWYNRHLK